MSSSIYSKLYNIVYQAKDLAKSTQIWTNFRRLKNEQKLTASALIALQDSRLRELLLNAYKNSNYWHQALTSAGFDQTSLTNFSRAELTKIPFLNREILQSNYRDILVKSPQLEIYKNTSGGSTGAPVIFYQDSDYNLSCRYHKLFFSHWMGVSAGDKTAIFWGADRDLKDGTWKEKLKMQLNREFFYNSFNMDDESLTKFISKLNTIRPSYIYGYASSLYYAASKIKELGLTLNFAPTAISSSAETLYDFQRELISEVFKAPIYNFYGSRETNNIAVECEQHQGLHINSSSRIVEIVDDNGALVPDGEAGHVAVTDLTNLSFPFIRYLNGDMATLSHKPCPCGRPTPRIVKLHGRSSDIITTRDNVIHGEWFTHLMYDRPEIKTFQFLQESLDEYCLTLVPRTKIEAATITTIEDTLRKKLGQGAHIRILTAEAIASTATGKHRFTISKINLQEPS